jgi:hypothetical protein
MLGATVVRAPLLETAAKPFSSGPIEEDIQDPASALLRIPLLRASVNKGEWLIR